MSDMLTKEEIRKYLDECILHWRKRRDDPSTTPEDNAITHYYIDAYQSVRVSLLGELLK